MIKVIYESKDFIALNKPRGVLVHGERPAVVDWLLKHYPEVSGVGDKPSERPGIVHRLDKETSGVLIVARNQKFFEYFKNLLQSREVRKEYLALVFGKLTGRGTIHKPIGLKSGTIKRSIHLKKVKMVKEAVTEYSSLKIFEYNNNFTIVKSLLYFTLVKVVPKTGRTHQIRVHLSSIGHPIVGDTLYGPKSNPLGLARQFLHAEAIEFSLESGRRIRIEAELPQELQDILQKL